MLRAHNWQKVNNHLKSISGELNILATKLVRFMDKEASCRTLLLTLWKIFPECFTDHESFSKTIAQYYILNTITQYEITCAKILELWLVESHTLFQLFIAVRGQNILLHSIWVSKSAKIIYFCTQLSHLLNVSRQVYLKPGGSGREKQRSLVTA